VPDFSREPLLDPICCASDATTTFLIPPPFAVTCWLLAAGCWLLTARLFRPSAARACFPVPASSHPSFRSSPNPAGNGPATLSVPMPASCGNVPSRCVLPDLVVFFRQPYKPCRCARRPVLPAHITCAYRSLFLTLFREQTSRVVPVTGIGATRLPTSVSAVPLSVVSGCHV
jgi:hypothetical protein